MLLDSERANLAMDWARLALGQLKLAMMELVMGLARRIVQLLLG